jgi:hypothetical protein
MSKRVHDQQLALCARYKTAFVDAPGHLKVGLATQTLTGQMPLNGLRHPPEGDTTGWYLWAGKDFALDAEADFFKPIHVAHLAEMCPEALRFLGLPPG